MGGVSRAGACRPWAGAHVGSYAGALRSHWREPSTERCDLICSFQSSIWRLCGCKRAHSQGKAWTLVNAKVIPLSR